MKWQTGAIIYIYIYTGKLPRIKRFSYTHRETSSNSRRRDRVIAASRALPKANAEGFDVKNANTGRGAAALPGG